MADYWSYAQKYSIADHFFSSIAGGSFPNHLAIIAGTSQNVIDDPVLPKVHGLLFGWGCDSPKGTTIGLYANGHRYTSAPCFKKAETLADEANAASPRVSWRYYAAGATNEGYIWSAYDAIKHIRYSKYWSDDVLPTARFDQDIASGNLAQVSWLTPLWGVSDHPQTSECQG